MPFTSSAVLKRATAFGILMCYATALSPISAAAATISTARSLGHAHPNGDPDFALKSNVAACALVDQREVQRSIDQIFSARLANAVRPVESAESRNILGGREARAAYVRSILKTKPARMPLTSVHPTTPVEYATFRAAETAIKQHATAAFALGQCRGQALAALAGGGRELRPNWESGPGGGPYFPTVLEAVTGSGGFSDIYASNGVPNSANVHASSGSVIGTTSYGSVTISGLPGTSGGVPGFGMNVSITGTAGKSVGFSVPNPAYVAQKGWTVVPGLTWKGSSVSMYLNPTASTPSATVYFDSADYLTVTQPSAGEIEYNVDAASTNVYIQNNCVFTSGAQGVGSGLMSIGDGAMALGAIGVGTGLFSPEGAVLGAMGGIVWGAGALTKWVFGPLFAGRCNGARHGAAVQALNGRGPSPECSDEYDDSDDDDF